MLWASHEIVRRKYPAAMKVYEVGREDVGSGSGANDSTPAKDAVSAIRPDLGDKCSASKLAGCSLSHFKFTEGGLIKLAKGQTLAMVLPLLWVQSFRRASRNLV